MTAPKKSKRTREEQIDYILAQLVKKRSLSEICEEPDLPTLDAFLYWVRRDADLSQRYAYAREAQVTGLLEDCLQIAEDATDDAYIWTDPKTQRQYARIDGKTARRSQLIIETRERFAKLMLPERFAQQRMDVTSGGKALPAPVQINDNRIQALITLAATRAQALTQQIDVTPTSIDDVMS